MLQTEKQMAMQKLTVQIRGDNIRTAQCRRYIDIDNWFFICSAVALDN